MDKNYSIVETEKGCNVVVGKSLKISFISFLKSLFSEKEIVICAAIRMPDGYVIRGHRHNNCIMTASQIPKYKGVITGGDEHGFVTSKNRYVTRLEGARIQKSAGIKSRLDGIGKPYLYGNLYSEDLY